MPVHLLPAPWGASRRAQGELCLFLWPREVWDPVLVLGHKIWHPVLVSGHHMPEGLLRPCMRRGREGLLRPSMEGLLVTMLRGRELG